MTTPETTEPQSPGARLIAAERGRQITAEGWDHAHDDKHDDMALIRAARAYVTAAEWRSDRNSPLFVEPSAMPPLPWWPWSDVDWKPSDDPIRNLVKAGALIAAEIDRLARREENTP